MYSVYVFKCQNRIYAYLEHMNIIIEKFGRIIQYDDYYAESNIRFFETLRKFLFLFSERYNL